MRTLVPLFCLLLFAGMSAAQDTIDGAEVARTYAKIRSFMAQEREQTIKDELGLTNAEDAAFWPVYKKYRAETDKLQDQYAKLLRNFVDRMPRMTDAAAADIIGDYFAIKSSLLTVRQRYVASFLGAIPARKLVRFYQMENKIDAVAELPLMLDIPLLEAGSPGAR